MKLKTVKFNEKITEREIEFVKIAYSQLDFYTRDAYNSVGMYYDLREFDVNKLKHDRIHEHSDFIFAYDKDEIVGMCELEPCCLFETDCVNTCENDSTIMISELFVTETYRNQGIGTALINEVKKLSGYKNIYLSCFINNKANNLYRKNGFELLDQYYWCKGSTSNQNFILIHFNDLEKFLGKRKESVYKNIQLSYNKKVKSALYTDSKIEDICKYFEFKNFSYFETDNCYGVLNYEHSRTMIELLEFKNDTIFDDLRYININGVEYLGNVEHPSRYGLIPYYNNYIFRQNNG